MTRRPTVRSVHQNGLMNEPQEQHLAGCVVLVTADRRSTELAAALTRHGAEIRHAPAISMVPILNDDELIATTRGVIAQQPDVVVVTTGIGFRGWIEAADAHGIADELVDALRRSRLVARGPKARGAIQAAGLVADWVAESETAAEIAEYLLEEGVAGLRIAVQHHGSGADGLDEAFLAAGAAVDSLVVYRWGPPRDPEAVRASVRDCASGVIDAVVFTSAPGAAAWLEAAERDDRLDALVASFREGFAIAVAVGPITAGPLRAAGVEPIVPERGRLGALIRILVAHYASRRGAALLTVAGPLLLRNTSAVLAGRVLDLTPTGFAVLRALARAEGGVVCRDDLLDELPGASRDTHAVEVAIARLRQAAGEPRLVRTVIKRGYRLELVSDV